MKAHPKLKRLEISLSSAVARADSIFPEDTASIHWIFGSARDPYGSVTMFACEKPANLRRWFKGVSGKPAGIFHDRLREVMEERFGSNIRDRVAKIEERYGFYAG